MSLATLKKKTKSKYSKISSSVRYKPKRELVTENNETYYKTTYETFHKPDYVGFSLNNPRRVGSHSNQGQTQTPMKGNVPRGHGSCCGKYPIVINKSNYNNYDNHVREYSDKSNQGISVKNHNGSIATRYKWLHGQYPNYVVKEMKQLDYSQYHDRINGQNATQSLADANSALSADTCNGTTCKKRGQNMEKNSNIVKRVDTLTQSEYLKTKLLNKKCLPTPNSKKHFPVPLAGQCVSGSGLEIDENFEVTEAGNCQ